MANLQHFQWKWSLLSTERENLHNWAITPINVQILKDIQDSLPYPIHFIEKGFQAKNDNSTQRKRRRYSILNNPDDPQLVLRHPMGSSKTSLDT